MRNLRSQVILILAAIFVGVAGFTIINRDQNSEFIQLIDRYNIFVKADPTYIKTADKYGVAQSPGGYNYTQEAYRADGTHYEVTFYADHKLKAGHYLKLKTKGHYVETYEEVQPDMIPQKARDLLKVE